MTLSYMEAIGNGFPNVQCHATGNGSVYSDIIWDGGDPLPSQAVLDAWIAINPLGIVLTKYQFRQLFTLNEKVAVDNSQLNPNIPANYKAILYTLAIDMQLSAEVELSTPNVVSGIKLLASLGLIGAGRAEQILLNIPPIPLNSVAPAVTGISQSGQMLSVTNGTWNSATSYAYQWFKNTDILIPGATLNTYVIQTADIGFTLSCQVTATNTYGSADAMSNIIAAPTA